MSNNTRNSNIPIKANVTKPEILTLRTIVGIDKNNYTYLISHVNPKEVWVWKVSFIQTNEWRWI